MSLIVNGTGIENVIVIKRATGESVELEKFQDHNGNVIWEKPVLDIHDVIFHIKIVQWVIDEGNNTVQLSFTKKDTTPNTVDWGDGSAIETITTAGLHQLKHTYTSVIETDIIIGGEGILSKVGNGSSGGALLCTGSGSSVSDGNLFQYCKLGKICEGIYGLPYSDELGINYYQTVSYVHNTTVKPFDYRGGTNLSKCYYNPGINWINGAPITNPIYQNETEQGDYLYSFEFSDKKLASMGQKFDKSKLGNYDINGILGGGVTSASENVYPASIKYFYFGSLAFTGGDVVLRFNNPAGAEVIMPNAGDGSGVAYYKNARAWTIYTDNETIKNYNWAADNITATIYHLDGSAW